MATETELKLRLDSEDVAALRQHPLLQQADHRAPQTLFNTYYDTPALDLAKARVALRIRRQGERYIQTLKTRGQSINGLHQRGEWEWDLDAAQLDPTRLSAEIWPAALPAAAELSLLPVFTTDFEREIWLLDYAGAHIEVALDRGAVLYSGEGVQLEDPIMELELELKSGDADALLKLADALASELPLHPFDLSKAQRGYALFRQAQATTEDSE